MLLRRRSEKRRTELLQEIRKMRFEEAMEDGKRVG